ncbi:MAG: DUF115 domain-containing protein [Lachnospiraceae bacterium]|nr:DUF115 domain-containing protein [Lachnospiraceae bacterium]
MKLKNIIYNLSVNNLLIGKIRYQYKRIKHYPAYRKEVKRYKKRLGGYEDERFEKIKKMKGMYQGKRCFIVATGPSLRVKDLEMLSDEITFGVNSIAKIGEKTEWRPTYLGIQDPYVYEKIEQDILQNFDDNVFAGDNLCDKFQIPERFILFPYMGLHTYYMNKYNEFGTKFSDDAYRIVYDGYSITFSMIQIAVYMGFKEIYLLGCDCNYQKGAKNHFIESGFIDRSAHNNYGRLMSGYKEAKKYIETHNDIKIINCTRGGMLELFPRKKLEEVLEEEKN